MGSLSTEVAALRHRLVATVGDAGSDPKETLSDMLCMACPLNHKFEVLNFCELLRNNGKSTDDLRKVGQALSILEKYGRHLLKPPESRSNMWRYIKYTNSIFRDRVDIIQGGRDIMALMGYTQSIPDGVAFPDNQQPDQVKISKLVADILLAKNELSAYTNGTHPYPHILDGCLSQELEPAKRKASETTPSVVMTTEPSTFSANIPSNNQGQLGQIYTCVPLSLGEFGETTAANMDNNAQVLTTGQACPDDRVKEDGSSSDEQEKLDQLCDICGEKQPVWQCEVCGKKQLCVYCDKKWHNHPQRLNHSRKQLRKVNLTCLSSGEHSTEGTQSEGKETVSVYTTPPSVLPGNSPGHSVAMPTMSTGPHVSSFSPGLSASPHHRHQLQHQYHPPSMDPTERFVTASQSALDLSMQSPHQAFLDRNQPVSMLTGSSTTGQMSSQGLYPPHSSLQIPMMPSLSQEPLLRGLQQGTLSHIRTTQGVTYPASQAFMYPPPAGGPQDVHAAAASGGHTNTLIYNPPNSTISPTATATSLVYPRFTPTGELIYVPAVSTPYASYSMHQASHQSNLSKSPSSLLEKVKAIPDLNKQRSRIDVLVVDLNEELEECETKLNNIIVQNPNFYADPDYSSLMNKKRRFLLKKKELKDYESELIKELDRAEGAKEWEKAQELMLRASKYKSLQKDNFQTKGLQQGPSLPAERNIVTVEQQASALQQSANKYALKVPPELSQVNILPGLGMKDVMPPEALSASTAVGPEELTGQERFDPNQEVPGPGLFAQLTTAKPYVSGKEQSSVATEKVSNIGPQVEDKSNTSMRTTQSASSLATQQNKDTEAQALPKAKSSSHISGNRFQWQCEHCTYINEDTDFACQVCYKTSQNPKKINLTSTSSSNAPPQVLASDIQLGDGEPCDACTYINQNGATVCDMCAKTQDKYLATSQAPGNVKLQPKEKEEDSATPPSPQGALGQRLAMEQDQVYLEKMEAHRRFKEDVTITESSPLLTEAAIQGTGPVIQGTGAAILGTVAAILGTGAAIQGAGAAKQGTGAIPKSKVIHSLKKRDKGDNSSDDSYDSFTSAKSSNDVAEAVTPPKVKQAAEGHGSKVKDTVGKPQVIPKNLDFAEAIKLISEKRAMEQMSIDGHELVRVVKAAEKEGFDIKEVGMALSQSMEAGIGPVEWLNTIWLEVRETVVEMAKQQGKDLNVGNISDKEAREHLKSCDCDLEEAVKLCVDTRQQKFQVVSESGEFSREDILTALYQNHGNVEETIDQLNHDILQQFTDHLWSVRHEAGAGYSGVDLHELAVDKNNSVSNSVVEEEDFQANVKNREIDTTRRIRMVFVEAKLKSWGRAETIIQILDHDMEGSPDLDCSFEDIVEAVRNCGDRRSSLVYLRQECGICYTCFPMTKMRNLGSCNCKICQECLKQNFEVVIRERFVRDWSCPLCSQPDLEDEPGATEYLGFLQLMLQSHVDQEVMTLFDIKLRDWHLQKDPKFRWCAHCACGFIWGAGEANLGMACPSCMKKTCFLCKKQWEEQHEGLTCVEFTQWKLDNDPELQTQGLARHLEENGIDCPSCKMRYSLAKGGCMHFKCPQCGHEFCSGCSQAFLQQGMCRQFKSCATKGLHCHHPRDCFYYLRDNDPKSLQELLKENQVYYNTEPPAAQKNARICHVMEQKEYGDTKKDEACGLEVQKGMAGLCTLHYKEYLVGLINKNKVDPITMMSVDDISILIKRHEKNVPKKERNESDQQLRRRMMKFIRDKFPLQR